MSAKPAHMAAEILSEAEEVSPEDALEQLYPSVAGTTRAKVLLNYTPEGEHSADQLKLLAGDLVYVHQKHSSGWWGGHKAGSDVSGWFPSTIVQQLEVAGNCEAAREEEQQPSPTSPGRTLGQRSACVPTASTSTLGSTTLGSMRSPLVTGDLRAVASPQTAGPTGKDSTGSAATCEWHTRCSRLEKDLETEQQTSKELRSHLVAAREQSAKCASTVDHLQSEVLRLGEAEKEARSLNERLRDELESLHSELDNFKTAARLEIETERHKTRQLQEHCEAQKSQIRLLEVALKDAQTRGQNQRPEMTKTVSDRTSPRLAARDAIHVDSCSREDAKRSHQVASVEGRSASATVQRRLFTQSSSSEEAHVSHSHTSLQARHVQASTSHAISSSHVPPRPTPRGSPPLAAGTGGQPSTQARSGRAQYVSSGPAVSSPAHGQHGGRSEASPRPGWRGQPQESRAADRMPAVRALVSEFERRSTSQAPGAPPRSADPSPIRCALVSPQTPSTSARLQSGTASARRPSPRAMDMEPAESPQREDNSHTPLIMGMSPMQRAVPLRAATVSASSPAQGLSVQDRIRQLGIG
mmetsp:Transcript_6857/g.12079  ORF Transcript_6857/g.12079 Transcript_6857/m.12079 type:complete len:582 (-) Transcript_6857:179-1924(-)